MLKATLPYKGLDFANIQTFHFNTGEILVGFELSQRKRKKMNQQKYVTTQ